MEMGHDGVADSRVAVQKANADAIAEQTPITIGSLVRAAPGSATSKPIANRPNDQPPPKKIALSNPFMCPPLRTAKHYPVAWLGVKEAPMGIKNDGLGMGPEFYGRQAGRDKAHFPLGTSEALIAWLYPGRTISPTCAG
jgi:hypothetical protein